MAKSTYSAGFHFVVSEPGSRPTRSDRKAIRSHSTKAQGRRRQAVHLQSWISPDRSIQEVKDLRSETSHRISTRIPKRIEGAFSGLDLAPGVEPMMIQGLVNLIDIDKEGVYPYDVCLRVHPVERGWFPYVVNDICCLHSMMFSFHTHMNAFSGGQFSRQATFHYTQTLKYLQARLTAFETGQPDLAFADSTIMAIIFLASMAEYTGDFKAAETHIDGLLRIVDLRGGLRSLESHNNIQVKVCRADLRHALRTETPTRLFRQEIKWDRFVADRGIIRCSHEPYERQIRTFTDSLDTKLGDCWKDLHAFSCMSNLAYQTTRKMSPHTYSEMMISILYRLVNLSFQEESLDELMRVALMAFSSTLFLTGLYMDRPYRLLLGRFDRHLHKLCQSADMAIPHSILLWLMMVYPIVAYDEPVLGSWQHIWLRKSISLADVGDWSQARLLLRAVMWVGFVHDTPGRKVFEAD